MRLTPFLCVALLAGLASTPLRAATPIDHGLASEGSTT